ncbi:F-box/LRR-repeat protein fbxl-1-like [Glycine max]|uniref:F-box/LRR-repeat protein fbxl-1-like n=1 Tax=Glycine max TaxID=3847 RepID=UPI00085FC54E|nr:F-box/LRR-repeat protein fbxl-1-like [Glycine max]
MGSLRNSDLILIAQCFPFLEHLDLSFPKDTDNSTFPVSDVSVKALSLALPMLHSVDLSRNFFINDASILNLCKNYNFLEQVTIFECHFITQRGIASTIKERPCLRSFRVSNFRHQGETLVLQGCCNYSYVGVLCLLSTCQSLEHLDLQNAEFLCDQRVEELCEYLGNLVSVNVGGCRMLTDLALFALVRGCPLLNEIRMGELMLGRGGLMRI